jgi:hypothetical protein
VQHASPWRASPALQPPACQPTNQRLRPAPRQTATCKVAGRAVVLRHGPAAVPVSKGAVEYVQWRVVVPVLRVRAVVQEVLQLEAHGVAVVVRAHLRRGVVWCGAAGVDGAVEAGAVLLAVRVRVCAEGRHGGAAALQGDAGPAGLRAGACTSGRPLWNPRQPAAQQHTPAAQQHPQQHPPAAQQHTPAAKQHPRPTLNRCSPYCARSCSGVQRVAAGHWSTTPVSTTGFLGPSNSSTNLSAVMSCQGGQGARGEGRAGDEKARGGRGAAP